MDHVRELATKEAEALAWTTPYPLLFLPALIQEKMDWVNRYEARQAALRRSLCYRQANRLCRSRSASIEQRLSVGATSF